MNKEYKKLLKTIPDGLTAKKLTKLEHKIIKSNICSKKHNYIDVFTLKKVKYNNETRSKYYFEFFFCSTDPDVIAWLLKWAKLIDWPEKFEFDLCDYELEYVSVATWLRYQKQIRYLKPGQLINVDLGIVMSKSDLSQDSYYRGKFCGMDETLVDVCFEFRNPYLANTVGGKLVSELIPDFIVTYKDHSGTFSSTWMPEDAFVTFKKILEEKGKELFDCGEEYLRYCDVLENLSVEKDQKKVNAFATLYGSYHFSDYNIMEFLMEEFSDENTEFAELF